VKPLSKTRKRVMIRLILDYRRRWLRSRNWREAQHWASETDRILDAWLAEFGTQKEHTPR
jgi:hypothetical protein